MTYIDAFYDRENDLIKVAERIDGKRVLRDLQPQHVFYYADAAGKYKSIFGDPCRKFTSPNKKAFHSALNKKREEGIRIFESDINPVFRSLANHYMGAETPVLNLCFFDIEADFHPTKGWAKPHDPFNAITAISFYLSATETLHTLALCPPTLTEAEGQEIASKTPDTLLFTDEAEMLMTFLLMIEDADCYSGWNSEGFDIPYLINRIKTIIGDEAAAMLCLWDQEPREREYIKFGNVFKTYETVGRVHLDYLLLYKKHNPQQQQSYKLDHIGEEEVGETKTPYDGPLDQLYKEDFSKFITYNRQDVMLLVKIDQKKKFIGLANQIAHENCILFKTTMGTVSFVEQAIINGMHAKGFIVPDRKGEVDERVLDAEEPVEDDEDDEENASQRFKHDGRPTPVCGAYVAKPKVGEHRHVGCLDVASLYPSAIRSLNMSPETIFGQVRQTETMALIAKRIATGTKRAEAWEGIFATLEVEHMQNRDNVEVTVDFEDGSTKTMTGAALYDFVFNPQNHLCISANGTLFRTDKEGMIPALLAGWYAERKELQAKAKQAKANASKASNEADRVEFLRLFAYFDQRQYASKIRLNALYGALLQISCRFHDERLGQSTTLTGRSIDRHMAATINELFTGKYDYRGDVCLYCDTDSVYFSAYEVLKDHPDWVDFDWSPESVIELYDGVADAANETFAAFMAKTFNTSLERGAIIKAGRDLIASKALFIKKKKYACLIYDLEGTRMDIDKDGNPVPGKLKAMGLDLKRSDTPKFMQTFLQSLLMDILTDADQTKMYEDIKAFRQVFKPRPSWEKGSPKKVNNLADYTAKVDASRNKTFMSKVKDTGKVRLPGHVRASINWNDLCSLHNDLYASRIIDGTRIVVCKLLPNTTGYDSIAFPVDDVRLPDWFKTLPFDDAAMENVIIDKKLDNLVGVLNWDLSKTIDVMGDEFFSF